MYKFLLAFIVIACLSLLYIILYSIVLAKSNPNPAGINPTKPTIEATAEQSPVESAANKAKKDGKNNYPDKFEYGDVELVFNSDPSDIKYSSILLDSNKIFIPSSESWTNKSAYVYDPTQPFV